LRLTGWLSLCKRVRDASGRIRGNIYAQHDEPLSAHDAEVFDPGWLDAVEEACRHGNRTVRLTALAVLQSLKSDSAMRHRHSRVAIIEVRLSGYQSPQAMANSRREQDELTHAQNRTQSESPGSETELSTQMGENKPGSDPELSRKTRGCDPVRKPNRYVIRTSTQCVEKN
ncbi:STY4528 family pathogenicity island replication protein, partial [Klebsiella pneumoniae]